VRRNGGTFVGLNEPSSYGAEGICDHAPHGTAGPANRVAGTRPRVCAAALGAAVLLGGCAPTRFEVQPTIPPPLVTRIPVVVGLHVPAAFRTAVHKEERDGAEYTMEIARPRRRASSG